MTCGPAESNGKPRVASPTGPVPVGKYAGLPVLFHSLEPNQRCQILDLLSVVTETRGSMNPVYVGIEMPLYLLCIN